MTAERPALGGQTWDEIASQPESWEKAVVQATAELPGYPAHGERVLIMGCGTSYYVALVWAWIREQAGHGQTDAVIASEFTTLTREYDRVIAISRSGTSVDVVEALERLDPSVPLTAVLGDVATPIGARANEIIDLNYADETSVVQTRFPTTLIAVVLARHGGGDLGELHGQQAVRYLVQRVLGQVGGVKAGHALVAAVGLDALEDQAAAAAGADLGQHVGLQESLDEQHEAD